MSEWREWRMAVGVRITVRNIVLLAVLFTAL